MGDGSWAAGPDMNFRYETRFDWVRVYQTREQNPLVGIEAVKLGDETQKQGAFAGKTADFSAKAADNFDLTGRKSPKGTAGVQIRAGHKVMVGQ